MEWYQEKLTGVLCLLRPKIFNTMILGKIGGRSVLIAAEDFLSKCPASIWRAFCAYWDLRFSIKLCLSNYPKGHTHAFWSTFLIKTLIRNGHPRGPCKMSKMMAGWPQGHQNVFWSTFLIKTLMRNGHSEGPCENSKMMPGCPKVTKMCFELLSQLGR